MDYPRNLTPMKSHIYYGEYSLKHWINLILNKNIILPGYQRHFSWGQDAVDTMMAQLKKKLFIPPIIIGSYSNGTDVTNLLIDGQQRLTSIILAYYKMSCPESKIKTVTLETESDEYIDDIDELDAANEWDLSVIVEEVEKNGAIDTEEAKSRCNCRNYDYKLGGDFYDTTFLGFSFIVPGNNDSKAQNIYYSEVFRNINMQGKSLSPYESRRSLYYLDSTAVKFFEPLFIKAVIYKKVTNARVKLDFVRYLASASRMACVRDVKKVAAGIKGKNRLETFFTQYVYANTTGEGAADFTILSKAVSDQRMKELERVISELDFPEEFNSYLESDLYYIGLVYFVVFSDYVVDTARNSEIKLKLSAKYKQYYKDEKHKSSVNALSYYRKRIKDSIAIYKKYASKRP